MWCTPSVGGPALMGTGDASKSSSRYSSSESFWNTTGSKTGSGDGDRGRFPRRLERRAVGVAPRGDAPTQRREHR